MNIFVLDKDPKVAARMLCDLHVNKMAVESAQMLSTVRRMSDGDPEQRPSKSGKRLVKYWKMEDEVLEDVLYKPVHMSHPCTVWTMISASNYMWHYEHFVAIGEEFKFRFGKEHGSLSKLKDVLADVPRNVPDVGLTDFAQAMKNYPHCMVKQNAVQAYRNYYHYAKPFAQWNRGRAAPDWWEGYKGSSL